MKRFLLRIVFFLAPLLTILTCFETSLRHIPNNYTYKKHNLLYRAKENRILVLGSSHAMYGIDPVYFSKKAFNLANFGQTFDFDYRMLKKYGSKMEHLETVIVPVSYFTLFYRLKAFEPHRVKNYSIYFGLVSSFSPYDNFELANGRIRDHVQRFCDYYVKQKSFTPSVRPLGFETVFPNPPSERDLIKSGKTNSRRHTKDDTFYQYNCFYLDKIVQFCEKRRINLVLFTPPAFHSYSENLNKRQLQMTLGHATEIAQRSKSVHFINLLYDDSFVAEDYYDADHLNESGAKKLTKMLDAYITEISVNK